MTAANWNELLQDKTAEKQWNIISNRLRETVNKNVPSKVVGSSKNEHRRPKWMNTRVISKIKRKRKVYENYLKTREGKEYIQYTRNRNAARA